MSKHVACLSFATLLVAATPVFAAAGSTPEQAADRVYSAGYGLVSKTQKASDTSSDTWEVWASKNGIPYEIRIDAESGAVLAANPAQDDD